jgi:autotransporter translocation and assembly factor TamB
MLAVVLAGVVILFALGIFVLQIPAVQQRVRTLAAETLHRQTGLRLEMGSLSGNLLTELSVDDLKLHAPSGPLLSAERLSIGYALPQLLRRALVIRYLDLKGLQIYVAREANGQWNVVEEAGRLGSSTGEAPSASPFAVLVKRFRIDAGTLFIRDEATASARTRRIDNIHLDLRLSFQDELKANLRQLAFSSDDPRLEVTALKGRLRYNRTHEELHLEGLKLKTRASAVRAAAHLGLSQPDISIDVTSRIETLSLAEMGRLLATPALDSGEISGKIDLQGTPRQLHHRLRLVLDGQQSLAEEGVLALKGDEGVALEARGSLRRIDPAAWPFVDLPRLAGDIDVDFTLGGNDLGGSGRQVHLVAHTADSRLAGHTIDSGDVELTLQNGDLSITEAAVVTPSGRLRFQAEVGGIDANPPFNRVSLAGEVRDFNPSVFLGDPLWVGEVNADFMVAAKPNKKGAPVGDSSAWSAGADLKLRSSMLFGTPVRRADAKANWDGRVLRLASFDLDSDLGRATLDGQAIIRDRSYRIGGDVTLPEVQRLRTPLTKLVPQLPPERIPTGDIRLSGLVEGRPHKIDITAQVKATGLVLEPVSIASMALNGALEVEGAAVSGRASGQLSDIDYQGHRFARAVLSTNLKPERLGIDLTLTHADGEQLVLKGSADQWRQERRRILIETLQVTGIGEPLNRLVPELSNDVPIRLRTDPDGIDIDSLRLSAGTASLQADGRLALNGPQRCRIILEDLSLERLESLWQGEPTLKGRLAAEVNLGGTAAAPVIDADVTGRDVSAYDIALSNLALRFDYRDEAARLAAAGFQEGRKLFDLNGRSDLVLRLQPFEFTPKPGTLQARVDAQNLNLSELPLPGRREVALDGLMTVELEAAGDLRQPQLTGFLSLQDGSLALPRHGLTYESLNVDLRLSPGKLAVEQLTASGEREGRLSLTGQILMDGWMPSDVDVHLTGKRAAFAWKREFTARIDPDIFVTGAPSAPVITGRIRITEGRINLDRLAAGGPAEIEVIGEQTADGQTIVTGERESGPLLPLSADVRIEIPRNVWLKGQSLNAEIAGTIRLKKETQAPFILTGSLNTVRGDYVFQNRRLKITRGEVAFQGLPQPDPGLDIQAETRIGDVTVIVRITGSVRKIELTLDSDPTMDQSDIVSYLVFGRRTDDLRSEQATSAEAAALNMAGNLAAKELNSVLGDTFKLDSFSIDPGEDGWGSGALSVGKYVARNIFVTYRYEFSAQNFGELEIEYELTQNFGVAAQVGNDRTSGVDLIWKFDF